MATGEVVGGILLAGDQLLRMEQLTVRTRADLIDHRRLQVDEDAARNVLASARLGEEGVERVITATDRLVARHLAVRLNTVLQAEELPATVADLATGLRIESRQYMSSDVFLFPCMSFFESFPFIITCL